MDQLPDTARFSSQSQDQPLLAPLLGRLAARVQRPTRRATPPDPLVRVLVTRGRSFVIAVGWLAVVLVQGLGLGASRGWFLWQGWGDRKWLVLAMLVTLILCSVWIF